MPTVAIIQARMGSTRLPGKVLADLAGLPVLAWVVRAARAAPGVDDVIVATSVASADDAVAQWCASNETAVHRGSQNDVLQRFVGAAAAAKADVIVRLTADCPLLDPAVVAQAIRLRKIRNADYASNIDPATWPDGLDCEVITADALRSAAAEAVRASDREHVTPFIRRNRDRFAAATLTSSMPDLSHERWTLDTPADLDFLRSICGRLPAGRAPSFVEVLTMLDEVPELRAMNQQETRNAGSAVNPAKDDGFRIVDFHRSQALLERAERVIPLGSQTFSKSKLQFPPCASPLFLSHGDGGRAYDVDGNEYVDLVSALLPNILGYRDPDVDDAIRRQLASGISLSLPTRLEAELAERLVHHIPCAEMVRFGKNGTDATSAAVRLARAATGRDRLMLLGYHGWQDWYIGATTRRLGVPADVSALSHLVPYGDLAAADTLFSEYNGEFAAVILEPAGATEPPAGYLEGLNKLAHCHGALVIYDEIITGFRFGLGGAQKRYGVTPDLACFGKAMGNGMPISAVVGRADIMRLMLEIFYSGTFGGEALSLAASIATIEKVEREGVVERLWLTGGELLKASRERIKGANLADVIKIVGTPPWGILAFDDHPSASKAVIKTIFLREMIAAGVLINASHNICFAHDAADVTRVLFAYDRALSELKDALQRGDCEQRLGEKIIKPIFSVRAS